jgi:hypothetical protein
MKETASGLKKKSNDLKTIREAEQGESDSEESCQPLPQPQDSGYQAFQSSAIEHNNSVRQRNIQPTHPQAAIEHSCRSKADAIVNKLSMLSLHSGTRSDRIATGANFPSREEQSLILKYAALIIDASISE